MIELPAALTLATRGELVAFVGGGGKTTLMFALARQMPGQVIVTTTTRIFAAQMKLAPAVCVSDNLALLETHLRTHGTCLVIGQVQGEKAIGVDPALPGQLLARPGVDAVLVEADGSRMRPIKAPAAHEPVIPAETTLVVPVVGIDALNGRVAEAAHRPTLVRALLAEQAPADDQLSFENVAALLTHPQGGLKGVPDQARVIPFINKVETPQQVAAAGRIAQQALRSDRILRVVMGAARRNLPVQEVYSRVTAVVLAAGQARRMGQTKQLLPWGETTVLGQTIRHVAAAAVTHVVVVSGHQAAEVEAAARAEGAAVVHNPHYAAGEMLSSLQTAVRHLPGGTTAVVVMLADQPMVSPAIIDALLTAYRQGRGSLIAPTYQGRRGNPVLIDQKHFAHLLALPPGAAPRDLLKHHPVHLVPVDSDSILRDLDRPEDYRRERPS